MSHLHSADENFGSIDIQIAKFKEMGRIFEDAGFEIKRKHIAASAGIQQIDDDRFTACRPGLLCYGYEVIDLERTHQNQGKKLTLKPALSLFSTIIKVQKLEK